MKFLSLLVLPVFLACTSTTAIRVSYDNTYDSSSGSLSTVACSDGSNGLLTKGFTTFGSLPHFPNIGGAQAVASWNSPNCGSCWNLTFKGTSISVLAVDHTDSGFNIAQAALDKLTKNQAVALGAIDATATQVSPSVCGLH